MQLVRVAEHGAGLGRRRPTALTVEVLIVLDRLLADVAHFSIAAGTGHLVAALRLEEPGPALVALPDQGPGELLLNQLSPRLLS